MDNLRIFFPFLFLFWSKFWDIVFSDRSPISQTETGSAENGGQCGDSHMGNPYLHMYCRELKNASR